MVSLRIHVAFMMLRRISFHSMNIWICGLTLVVLLRYSVDVFLSVVIAFLEHISAYRRRRLDWYLTLFLCPQHSVIIDLLTSWSEHHLQCHCVNACVCGLRSNLVSGECWIHVLNMPGVMHWCLSVIPLIFSFFHQNDGLLLLFLCRVEIMLIGAVVKVLAVACV